MIRALSGMTALLMALLVVAPAGATIGDDDSVELLGYDAVDKKLYYLEFIGGSGDPPRLYFLALGGADPARPVAVRSWYTGPDEPGRRFADRLKTLRARLAPLGPSSIAGARLVVEHGPLRVCSDAPVKPKDAAAARAAVEAWRSGRGDIETPACRPVTMRVDWKGYGAGHAAEVWDHPTLVDLRPLPDPRFVVAVVRYGGKHFESGYAVERVLLLRKPAATP